MYKNVTVISHKMYFLQHSVQWWRYHYSWLVGALCRKAIIHWSIHTRQSNCCLIRLV